MNCRRCASWPAQNSIFIGDVLLTTKNPQRDRDAKLLDRLGITSGLTCVKQGSESAVRKI